MKIKGSWYLAENDILEKELQTKLGEANLQIDLYLHIYGKISGYVFITKITVLY